MKSSYKKGCEFLGSIEIAKSIKDYRKERNCEEFKFECKGR